MDDITPATTTTQVERRSIFTNTDPPFSLAAGFFGWAAGSFFLLVLATLILAVLGAAAYNATGGGALDLTQRTFNELTTFGMLGLVVAAFVAYFLGGYAAGRIGLTSGAMHGVAVFVWTILFALLALALGYAVDGSVNASTSLAVTPRIDWSALTTMSLVAMGATLLAMLAGAMLGGMAGERWFAMGERRTVMERRVRGRPL